MTVTAPGTHDHRLTYQGKRPRGARPACYCHEHGLSAGVWNGQESACWNRLRTSLARGRVVQFAGSVETQRRGLLHRHLVLFTDDVLSHAEVQRLAVRAGYGCVTDVEPLQSAAKAGRYIAKYVTKSTAERPEVPWAHREIDYDTGEVVDRGSRATFRLWSSSRQWGVTMKQVRAVAAAQARARARHLASLSALLAEEGIYLGSPEGTGGERGSLPDP